MGGSKKRKAAKKKKASQLNSIVQHNNENDELKNQEERDSEAGEKELERRDELPPVQSNASETEGGDGVDIDGTQIVVGLEEVKSESNDDSELESKTDEQKLEAVLDAATDSLVPKESAAEMNDAVENSLVIDTVESVAATVLTTEETTKDSETMLNTSSKVEETAIIDESDVSTLIVEQDKKPLPVSEGSSARAIDLVENTKSPETFQKNQKTLVVEKASWLGCCGMFDLLRGGR